MTWTCCLSIVTRQSAAQIWDRIRFILTAQTLVSLSFFYLLCPWWAESATLSQTRLSTSEMRLSVSQVLIKEMEEKTLFSSLLTFFSQSWKWAVGSCTQPAHLWSFGSCYMLYTHSRAGHPSVRMSMHVCITRTVETCDWQCFCTANK